MLHKTAEIIVCTLFGKDNPNTDNYIYGIELFLSSFICSVLLLLIGIISNTFLESVIFIVCFSALRIFTGGYHAHSFLLCTVITLLNYFLIVFVYRWLLFYLSKTYVNLPVFIISLLIIILLAPVENPSNPFDQEQAFIFKKRSIIILLVEIMVFYTFWGIFSNINCLIMIPTLMSVDIFMIVQIFSRIKRRNARW